ncbi:ubiquitin-conjugating enzyme E2 M [Nematocida sp. AWRm77]|nr:ubiquitin-conjugating enzyme E2 M [Nematocida sp. AWRm77]
MKQPLSVLRVKKEMEDLHIQPDDRARAEYREDGSSQVFYSLYLRDGIYGGQRYEFVINVPNNYPFAPPKAIALSKVFHPSIDAQGRVCMNITREDWSITQGLQTVVFGLSSIFYDVPKEEPLNQEAHALLLEDSLKYASYAREVYRSNQSK